MSSFADKVFDRLLDFELPLENLFTDGLNVELIEGSFEKFTRDPELLVQLIRKIENDFRAKIEKIPSLEIFEKCLGRHVEARRRIESVGDELQLSLS